MNFRHNRAAISRCDGSLNTVREGYHCPTNPFQWKERARQMKCETISQNCTESDNFVYHCLINAWPNGTIEVCAPRRTISGHYCAEFSKGGARVQAQFRSKCKSCPFKYNSSDSFKYRECYDLVKVPEISTKQGHIEGTSSIILDTSNGEENLNFTNTTDKGNVREKAMQTGLIVGFLFLIVLLVPVALLFKRRRKQNNSADRNTKAAVNELKLNKKLVKYLSKLEKEKPECLRKRILESSNWQKYAEINPSCQEQIESTGNFKEDLAIQAAADVLEMRIYIVIRAPRDQETVICFLPKDPDADKKWIKMSLSQKKKYKLLSDWIRCNEEEAPQLAYDDDFNLKVGRDGGETNSHENVSEILITR